MNHEVRDENTKRSSEQADMVEEHDAEHGATQEMNIEAKIVDVRELVYGGGSDRDPQELLTNPAVAPQMLDDRRDVRSDLMRDSENPSTDV
ncbi:hypothetical protein [Thermocoleostomius sinensis]|uniref:Uncharacterized protein n=1 Tax=Thermocoleostomius sinensis A174 TaxID=2016057 RepID=A0A9E9C9B7_9CYAN|nr:hypothetical protein [Thermocoleostomius sinensis]WAL61383.1 hypothetical protein OXH18_05155 [Thermocoleostomius sinensis A174]